MGQMGGQFAPESTDTMAVNPRQCWRLVQELLKHFWHRWLTEWIRTRNSRWKLLNTQRDFQVDNVVLVPQPDVSHGQWPLRRITNVKPGPEGHVRVVYVKLGKKEYKRVHLQNLLVGSLTLQQQRKNYLSSVLRSDRHLETFN